MSAIQKANDSPGISRSTLTIEIPVETYTDRYEVVDGQKLELPPMSVDSSVVAFELQRALMRFCDARELGRVMPETKFKLALPVERNRIPDLAFVPYSIWPEERRGPRVDAWEVTPSLCVEVVSPTDKVDDLDDKVLEYLQAGVGLVWVIHPRGEKVEVYVSVDSAKILHRKDTLTGGDVLPGFELPLAKLFPLPEAQEIV